MDNELLNKSVVICPESHQLAQRLVGIAGKDIGDVTEKAITAYAEKYRDAITEKLKKQLAEITTEAKK